MLETIISVSIVLLVWFLVGFIVFLGDIKGKKKLIDDLKHKRLELKSFGGSLYQNSSDFVYLGSTESFCLEKDGFIMKISWFIAPYERYLWEQAHKYLEQNYPELI